MTSEAAFHALFDADQVVRSAAHGFPESVSSWLFNHYCLSGPLVDTSVAGRRDGCFPPDPSPTPLNADDTGDILRLVQDLCRADSRCCWAAAVVEGDGGSSLEGDGGSSSVWLSSNRGASFIPPGIHLPHNVGLVCGEPADQLFLRMYGWDQPAERLLAYADLYGWKIRELVAVCRKYSFHPDPFEWVRPAVSARNIGLTACSTDDPPGDVNRVSRVAPASGGRHRLEVVCPSLYASMATAAEGDTTMIRELVESVASLTISAARTALDVNDAGGGLVRTSEEHSILATVAESTPEEIADLRLGNTGSDTDTAMGLAAFVAPQWGQRAAYAYDLALIRARAKRGCRYDHVHAGRGDDLLNEYVAAELDAMALEAIFYWSADPLPVSDIGYAARMVTGRWS